MLQVDREYTNTHDANAWLIWIPPLYTFSREIHETVTLLQMLKEVYY